MSDPIIPLELIEHLNRQDCVLFVGDALDENDSLSLQLASRLMDRGKLHSQCDISACSSTGKCTNPTNCTIKLFTAAQYYESEVGRHDLISFVEQQVENIGPPGPIHDALARLPVRVIITTAYDDRLEIALKQNERPFKLVVGDTDVPFDDPENVQLIRLHGKIGQRETLLLTENDTIDLFARLPAVKRILQAHFASKTLLFVGYNLKDPHFKALHRQVTEPLYPYQRLAYAIQWPPNPLEVKRWHGQIAFIAAEPIAFLAKLVQSTSKLIKPKTQSLKLPDKPYKFLDFFTREDSAIFFGRDLEADLLLSTILAHKLTVFYGRSGTGKTSLLLARVGPLLEEAGYRLIYARMLGDPTSEVKAAVLGVPIDQLADTDQKRPLISVLMDILSPQKGPLVIVLDQFEEFFLRHGEAVRRAFIQELADCLRLTSIGATLDLHLVFSLRDDYLGSLDELAGVFPQDVFSHRYKLENLTRDKALQAIFKPAEAFGLPIEESLREQLIDDLEDQGLESTNLQIVLYRMYQDAVERGMWFESTKQGQGLTLTHYQALGGARAILGGYLDKVLSELPQAEQEQARVILKSMVTSQQTKMAISGQELTRADLIKKIKVTETQVDTLLDYLRQKRIVRKFGDTDRYELSHEVMVEKVWAWISDEELRLLDVRDMLRRELSSYQKFDHLLAKEKLDLIDSCREALMLNTQELVLILRSAFTHKYEVVYWFERSLHSGLTVTDLWQHRELLIPPGAYILENIRKLLTEGFNTAQLRNVCSDVSEFRPVYHQLADETGKVEIIDRLIKYADHTSQFELVVGWAHQNNPARYELYEPYLNKSEGPILSPEAFRLLHDHHEELTQLTQEELELFLRSAFITRYGTGYWYERAQAEGVDLVDLQRYRGPLISGEAVGMIPGRNPRSKQLTKDQLETFFRSALTTKVEVAYWFKRAYENGVPVIEMWQGDRFIPIEILTLIHNHYEHLKPFKKEQLALVVRSAFITNFEIITWFERAIEANLTIVDLWTHNELIPYKALELFHNNPDKFKPTTKAEFEQLLRSALIAGYETENWFEQAIKEGVRILEIWQQNYSSSSPETLINFKNIRILLMEGFSEEEIRQFCQDRPSFNPLYFQLSPHASRQKMVEQLVKYSDETLQIINLLSWVKEYNPARYERHQPYYNSLYYNSLIAANAFKLIHKYRKKLHRLTLDDLKLLLRSAAAIDYEVDYWLARAIKRGLSIVEIWLQMRQLIPVSILQLIYKHRRHLKTLSQDELQWLLRSAFAADYEIADWLERAIEGGVSIMEIWQQNELFIQPQFLIKFSNVRNLLLEFTDEELRKFCRRQPEFTPVYENLSSGMGKNKTVSYLIEYARQTLQIDRLLTLLQTAKPAEYKDHQPYYNSFNLPQTLKVIYEHQPELESLSHAELTLLLHVALASDCEVSYWLKCAIEAGLTLTDIWQPKDSSIPYQTPLIENIRLLLTYSLTHEELRSLCLDEFREIYEQLSDVVGATEMVKRLLEYVTHSAQLGQLLNAVQKLRPTLYEYYQPYYNNRLIPPRTIKLLYSRHSELKQLSNSDLDLLFRSALEAESQTRPQSKQVSVTSTKQFKRPAIPDRSPILENIRLLLIQGFSAEELRRLCYDKVQFREVYGNLSATSGKAEIAHRLIEYANNTAQINELLTWAEQDNPSIYQKHQPYYSNVIVSPSISIQIKPRSEFQLLPASTVEYGIAYWLEQMLEANISVLDIWRHNGQLIPPTALTLLYNAREKLKSLSRDDFELLLHSTVVARQSQQGTYWLERALKEAIITETTLLSSLAETNFRTRAVVVIALGWLGGRFIKPIVEMLADEYPQVRVAALETLEQLASDGDWRKQLRYECYIPAGKFIIGNDNGEDSEQPAHSVYLNAFYIAKYPVTNADYKRYMDDCKRDFTISPDKTDHPVVEVSWYDACDYAAWAGMRLLTEAEWEKAASWVEEQNNKAEGRKRRYPWGDEFDQDKCNTTEAGIGTTTSVGKYSSRGDSFFNVADMTGNVWEWCSSTYKEYPYQVDDGREDLASTADRVQRGGSFEDGASVATCVYRYWNDPSSRYRSDGFRVGWSTPSSTPENPEEEQDK